MKINVVAVKEFDATKTHIKSWKDLMNVLLYTKMEFVRARSVKEKEVFICRNELRIDERYGSFGLP